MAHVYDFSKNIVPGQDDRERGYWRDVGTIDSYFAANMDLIAPLPAFNLYNDAWPVYTYRGAEPPAKVSRGPGYEPSFVDGSLLCQGSIVSGAHVERSIISTGCYVSHDAHVTDFDPVPRGPRRPRRPPPPLHRRQERAGPEWHRIGLDAEQDRERFTVSDAASPSSRRTASSEPEPGPRALERSGAGQGRDDRGEGVDVVGTHDDVAEAELLAAAHERPR